MKNTRGAGVTALMILKLPLLSNWWGDTGVHWFNDRPPPRLSKNR
jgi:hypothetical protein